MPMTKMANRVSLSIKYRDGSENLADGFRLPPLPTYNLLSGIAGGKIRYFLELGADYWEAFLAETKIRFIISSQKSL